MPPVVIHSDNPQHLLIMNMAKLVKGLKNFSYEERPSEKKLHLPTLKYRRISQFSISADAGCYGIGQSSPLTTVANCSTHITV